MSTKDVADFIVGLRFGELPPNVVRQATLAVRDTLGVTIAGYNDVASEATRKVGITMAGREESTIIGAGVKVPCNVASWVNAVTASTLDMDDGSFGPEGHRCHAGAVVVPSALATGEIRNVGGKELLEAIIIGYEVALRVGWMLGHAMAGIGGVFGAAAAAAKLMHLDSEEIVHALGIAGAHCPVPLHAGVNLSDQERHEYYKKMAMTKENIGWAAMTGVSAALLARDGFRGPSTIFDISHFPQKPIATLGHEWEILRVYFKPYSVCRALHASIDGVLTLVQEHAIQADDIATITAGVSSIRAEFNNPRPTTRYEAQYSIPFALGAALTEGEVGPRQIAWERLNDEEILQQANKVKVVTDPRSEELSPGINCSTIEIGMKDGRLFKTFIKYPSGEPENALSEDVLRLKFITLATYAMEPEKALDLNTCLEALDDISGLAVLVEKIGRF